MAEVMFTSYQQLNSRLPQKVPKGNSLSRPGVFGSINYGPAIGSRPTSSHRRLKSREASTTRTTHLYTLRPRVLRTPQESKCCCRSHKAFKMGRRSFILLLALFLFQPPACEATPPVFEIDSLIRMLYIPADIKPGTPIYRMEARDNQVRPDHPITFTMSGTAVNLFSLHTLNDLEANLIVETILQRGRIYALTITATDTAKETTSTSLRINATGFPSSPSLVFTKYPTSPITVPENSPKGMVIAKFEVRKNSFANAYPKLTVKGSNKFSLINSDLLPDEIKTADRGSNKFELVATELLKDTRGYNLILKESLDYEDQVNYFLNVSAVGGYRDMDQDNRNIIVLPVTVVVGDVQDTAPVFSHLPLLPKIPVDVKVGDVVFTLRAKDGGRGNIIYRIEGQYSRFFTVNGNGGVAVAYSLKELLIDCQDSPIILTIRAEETGRRSSTTSEVVVLIQNPPSAAVTFNPAILRASIDENAPINTPLRFATPPEVESQGDCGIIQLELRAKGGQLVAPDIFEVKPSVLFKSKPFQILVKDPTQLDYEKVQSIAFEVSATNLRAPQSTVAIASINVTITDLNDNNPVFNPARYFARIPENALENHVITQVTATDVDSGKFGTVRYTGVRGEGPFAGNTLTPSVDGSANQEYPTILSATLLKSQGQWGGLGVGGMYSLAVHPVTGQVTLTTRNHGLDREQQAKHIITVEAKDNEGFGTNVSTAEIEVNLQDINDNAPMFSRRIFHFCLPENLKKGELFWIARAMDADEENTVNSQIRYELARPNEYFEMSNDGRMTLTRDASAITGLQDVELDIKASDMGNPIQLSMAIVRISWDKRTCQKITVEYLVDQYPSSVQANRGDMERLLTDLNGGAITKIEEINSIGSGQPSRTLERYSSDGNNKTKDAKTRVKATVIQDSNNAVVDLTVMNRLNTPGVEPGVEPVEQYRGGGVSDAWKWVLIALIILLAFVLMLLLCCCLCKPTRKKTTNNGSQRSQVVEVATVGGPRHRHHHHHHRQPPGERTSSAPTDRRAANGRAAAYSRHMQEEGSRPRKSLDGTDGEEIMVDPATGKKYRVRYENGRRILVRSGEVEQGGKKVTRGTNVTENSLQPEAVETTTTPPMTVVEGDDDQKQLLKNQFLEKKSLFTIAYDGMHSKHDLLKDIDDPPNIS